MVKLINKLISLMILISLFSISSFSTGVMTFDTGEQFSVSNTLPIFNGVNMCLNDQGIVTIGYNDYDNYKVLGTDKDFFSSKIMEALDYLDSRGGGILFIKDGTYYLDNESISGSWSNIKITGDRPIIKNIDSVSYSVDNFFNMFRLTGNNNIIENIIIDGNQQNNGASPELHGLRITGNNNIIQNLYINNSRDPIMIDVGEYNIISNNIINNVAEYGITIRANAKYNLIESNIIKDVRGIGSVAIALHGIRVDNADYNTITNNLIENSKTGIYLTSDPATGNKISENILINIDSGIYSGGGNQNNSVTNNQIINVLNGSGIRWQGQNSLISGNKITSIVSTSENNYGIELYGSCLNSIASNNDLINAEGGDGRFYTSVFSCSGIDNIYDTNTANSVNVDYNIYNGNLVLESSTSANTQSLTIEGFRGSSGASYSELIFWNRGDADYLGAKIASQNDGNNNDGNLEFHTTNGLITALSMSIDQVGNIYMKDLVGTYGGGSAYVCVLDSGIIYASDVACP